MRKIKHVPQHVAIILDGNGRWAKRRGLPRSIGHYYGGKNISTIAKYANKIGIKQLTLYAFSTENWNRPQEEVDYLMSMPVEIIDQYFDKITNSTMKIEVVGRRDRIPNVLLETIERLEKATKHHLGLNLVLCVDYGAYDEILTAVKKTKHLSIDEITRNMMVVKPVDLLIRPGGELRLSNFLLWQSAYAELYFLKKFWPAFKAGDLHKACMAYSKRNRRFGGIKA